MSAASHLRLATADSGLEQKPILDIVGLSVDFETEAGRTRVVSDVAFQVDQGRTLGLVGESGSGKTVTGLTILGLISRSGHVTGRIEFQGTDLLQLSQTDLRAVRGRDIAMIFQEPRRSLDPSFTVGDQIAETARRHLGLSRRASTQKAVEMLDRVGIPMASKRAREYPHTFSGGMCQRVMLAIALVTSPKLLIADEPTTALDATVQARVLELLRDLQAEMGLAVIFITHDLAVVAEMSDDLAVMYAGQIVERGRTADIFRRPHHPYTEGLLRSLPQRQDPAGRMGSIPGTVPAPHAWPSGCRFAPRCGYAVGACDAEPPKLDLVGDVWRRCLRSKELVLEGV